MKTMLVFRWKQNTIIFPWLALRTKNENTTMAPWKTKKEQFSLRRAALEKKSGAKHATALQEVSLSGEVLEQEDDESMSNKLLEVVADALTANDDEKSSQSKETSGKSGASKCRSSTSAYF
jgi:hypothetical protein